MNNFSPYCCYWTQLLSSQLHQPMAYHPLILSSQPLSKSRTLKRSLEASPPSGSTKLILIWPSRNGVFSLRSASSTQEKLLSHAVNKCEGWQRITDVHFYIRKKISNGESILMFDNFINQIFFRVWSTYKGGVPDNSKRRKASGQKRSGHSSYKFGEKSGRTRGQITELHRNFASSKFADRWADQSAGILTEETERRIEIKGSSP